jgi:hypothetical protein
MSLVTLPSMSETLTSVVRAVFLVLNPVEQLVGQSSLVGGSVSVGYDIPGQVYHAIPGFVFGLFHAVGDPHMDGVVGADGCSRKLESLVGMHIEVLAQL